mmetsp:Transcript_653/g.1300  ORF Transcript_653/g.1300 Transcript_653/m.1300 type:complete len:88 (+) Transcript_653:461-724(+)
MTTVWGDKYIKIVHGLYGLYTSTCRRNVKKLNWSTGILFHEFDHLIQICKCAALALLTKKNSHSQTISMLPMYLSHPTGTGMFYQRW